MAREIICLTHHTWVEGMCNYGGDLACRDCTEQRIKQLEEEQRDLKKTISNQTESYSKALNYNNDLENQVKQLEEENQKLREVIEEIKKNFNSCCYCEEKIKIAEKASEEKWTLRKE